jgi:hypothetical protein
LRTRNRPTRRRPSGLPNVKPGPESAVCARTRTQHVVGCQQPQTSPHSPTVSAADHEPGAGAAWFRGAAIWMETAASRRWPGACQELTFASGHCPHRRRRYCPTRWSAECKRPSKPSVPRPGRRPCRPLRARQTRPTAERTGAHGVGRSHDRERHSATAAANRFPDHRGLGRHSACYTRTG